MSAWGARETTGNCRWSFALKLDLLGDPKSVVHLHTKVSDGAFKLRVTKQNLDSPEIAGLLVYLRRLRSPH